VQYIQSKDDLLQCASGNVADHHPVGQPMLEAGEDHTGTPWVRIEAALAQSGKPHLRVMDLEGAA
jgi:hypothetical protein